jgi:23S rRNA G2069 N7-methylase RlmK/C1962 C5-methylase RlmI
MPKTNNKKADEPNKFENEFPTLGQTLVQQTLVQQTPVQQTTVKQNTTMNFSNLFKEEEIVPKEIKTEMKKGFVKLTKNGVIDSLTEEEQKMDDDKDTLKKINNNMAKLYNHIEINKQRRLAWDMNYLPEVVVDEYSSSDHYTTEESDEYAEDPEDDFYDL